MPQPQWERLCRSNRCFMWTAKESCKQWKTSWKKKAVTTQIARMEQGWKPELGKSILIGHADDPEAADMLKERLLEQFPDSEICIAYIGPIIGAHTGPGALALIYWGNNR